MRYLTWLWLLISLLIALLVTFGVLNYDTKDSFWDRLTVSILWWCVSMFHLYIILDNKLKTLKEEKDAS